MRSAPRASAPPAFTLYVEGPRDRSILRAWAYRMMPGHARRLFGASVILGGRQPERALEHFRENWADDAGGEGAVRARPGWGRRSRCRTPTGTTSISSPGVAVTSRATCWCRTAIQSRAARCRAGDHRIERALEEHRPVARTRRPGNGSTPSACSVRPRSARTGASARRYRSRRSRRPRASRSSTSDVHELFAKPAASASTPRPALKLLALDFDGVVSDSAPECFVVALRTFAVAASRGRASSARMPSLLGLAQLRVIEEVRESRLVTTPRSSSGCRSATGPRISAWCSRRSKPTRRCPDQATYDRVPRTRRATPWLARLPRPLLPANGTRSALADRRGLVRP